MNSRATILIVDDDALVRRFVVGALEDDFELMLAGDGLEAMQRCEGAVERIACVITDLNMPRVSGEALVQWLKQQRPGLPVLVMTGNPFGANLERLLAQSPIAFLEKPFSVAQLQSALHGVLSLSTLGQGIAC